ncbi:MAG: DUF2332 domain-containing protein [Ktedonobacteraceae bacterium]|nr:DUF2332 domain-containing protein [Ktedonobacteraceae bacterium]MBO0792612.1 DUF2332 domain-containing protein [Ktedonobacteraceae bacterium]
MDASPFEEQELTYLRQSFISHGTYSFGRSDPPSASPLYSWLALQAAEDQEVLKLVMHANTRPQRPHMLFAAVQYLLLSGIQDPLRDFYPNLTEQPHPRVEAYPTFRAFCLRHAAEVRHLVTTYGVQNNEVGRCSDLLLAFNMVAQRGGGRPLAMIELGPSAGLNMLWDLYGYNYGIAGPVGDQNAPVQLYCEPRGELLPPVPRDIPMVGWRMGIDLNPIDIHDDHAVRWLRALIWPEHRERAQRIELAMAMARQQTLTIVAGDAVDHLPTILAQVPANMTLCIYHSYALNQTPSPVRERIFAQIEHFAAQRELFRVSEEWYANMKQAELELFTYHHRQVQHERLAICESHGRWLKWLAGTTQDTIAREMGT